MTKKQKIEAIYKVMPHLANDDIGLILYLIKRCGYPDVTLEQAMRKLGNPEHWTRAARLARAESPGLVEEKVRKGREDEFVEYKYNGKPQTAISCLND